nr:thioesterase family protein [Mesorhizobium sp. WSM4875]
MQADPTPEKLLDCRLKDEWLDTAGHVSNFGLHAIFAESEEKFLTKIEIDDEYLKESGCSAATVESHMTVVRKIEKKDKVNVSCQVLDLTNKAVHIVMDIKNSKGEICAYHESILLSVKRTASGAKVSPFGRYQLANLVHLSREHKDIPRPTCVGRSISIERE